MTMKPSELAEIVRRFRKRKNWSQEELGLKSGLTTRSICAIEQGQVKDPRHSSIQALGRVFGNSFFAEVYGYNHNPVSTPAVRAGES